MFNDPLGQIRVASPCPADWKEMYGDDRKRFCSECKLNVYNLSDMTRREAESLLINSEGRLCVRYYRRADGSVLTRDCPVGLKAFKRRVSRAVTATASIMLGFVSGIFAVRTTETLISILPMGDVPEPSIAAEEIEVYQGLVVGELDVLEVKGEIIPANDGRFILGRPVIPSGRLRDR